MKKYFLLSILILSLFLTGCSISSGNQGSITSSYLMMKSQVVQLLNSGWKFQVGGLSTSTAVLFCDPAKGCYHSGALVTGSYWTKVGNNVHNNNTGITSIGDNPSATSSAGSISIDPSKFTTYIAPIGTAVSTTTQQSSGILSFQSSNWHDTGLQTEHKLGWTIQSVAGTTYDRSDLKINYNGVNALNLSGSNGTIGTAQYNSEFDVIYSNSSTNLPYGSSFVGRNSSGVVGNGETITFKNSGGMVVGLFGCKNQNHSATVGVGDCFIGTANGSAATQKMVILGNGNVGIGTTTSGTWQPTSMLSILARGNNQDLFKIGSTTEGDVMTITKANNIGIGNVSPNTNLLINSTANTVGLSPLQLYNSIGTVGQVGIGFRISTSLGNDFAQIRADRTNSPSSGDSILEFFNTKSTIFSESMRIDTAGRVGIGTMNTVTWGQTFNVAGNSAFYHSVATGTVPTLATSTGAGAHSQKSLVKGHDANGIIQVNTAGSPAINSPVITLTFGTAYATIPSCTFTPYNDNADILSGVTNVYGTSTTAQFQIYSGSTGLTASKKYMWAYQCEE